MLYSLCTWLTQQSSTVSTQLDKNTKSQRKLFDIAMWPWNTVMVAESGMIGLSLVSITIMQSLTFITFMHYFASTPASNWHKLSELIIFSVFMLYVAWKKRTSSKIRTFCPILSNQKAFSLTSCVFWIFFSERRQSTLFQIFLCRQTARKCQGYSQWRSSTEIVIWHYMIHYLQTLSILEWQKY